MQRPFSSGTSRVPKQSVALRDRTCTPRRHRMHDTLGMHKWRKQCLKQSVIDSGMCENTLAHLDPHTAKHRTPLPPHNVDTSEPQRRLQKRAFISHRPEPPPESIQHWFVGVRGWHRRWHGMRRERLFRTYRTPDFQKRGMLHPTEPRSRQVTDPSFDLRHM